MDQFVDAFLEGFVPSVWEDRIRDEFDQLEQGSMIVTEYGTRFHALSRYSYKSIFIESEKIQKFVKGLDVYLQLATT